jgi:uncharacterized SAM-binding protein YcdF (DUF218 family)
MFFFLSKTVTYLVMPLTLILVFWLLSVLIRNKRWKKICFWSAFSLFLFFTNEFIANEVMLQWEVKAVPYEALRPHELGIVLTGVTIQGLEPRDRIYFAKGADRVTHTVQLYKTGLIKKILISGGTGTLTQVDEPEADKFRTAMLLMGVDSSDMMIENQTRNTHESAIEVKRMLDSLHYKPEDCLLITSAFHLRRSLACYRKVGLALEPFSTDFYTHPRRYHVDAFIIPKLEAVVIWQRLLKEWMGFAAYKAAGYI